MLTYYDGRHFIINGKEDLTPCPAGNTEALCRYSKDFLRNGTTQVINNVKVLSGEEYAAVAYHYGTGLWNGISSVSENGKSSKKAFKNSKWKQFLRKPSHFDFVEKHFGKKALKYYILFAYDFQEYGLLHFIKRAGKK